ncbi:cytochrome c oxidase subunit II [Halosegnis sp.]|uniref:cytochrome c oxidase subunit II n=1 Tax=Halosegnis sp. TaxID=2864959 RepID=UPI0035D49F1E
MIRARIATAGAGLLALLALAVDPVAAQTSLNDELITGLNLELLYVAVVITVIVEAVLIYTVVRYKDNDEPKPTQENRRLEITWTVTTAVILLFVGAAAYQVLGVQAIGGVTAASNPNAVEPATTYDFPGAVGPSQAEDDETVEVEVIAQKYYWTYNYPEHRVNGSVVSATSTAGEPLVIPKNRPVYFHVASVDWLHAFHVPDLGLKQDAFPEKYNTIKTVAYEEGTYQLYCAEYCGVGHSAMLGKVKVVSQEEYQQWLDKQKSEMKSESSS